MVRFTISYYTEGGTTYTVVFSSYTYIVVSYIRFTYIPVAISVHFITESFTWVGIRQQTPIPKQMDSGLLIGLITGGAIVLVVLIIIAIFLIKRDGESSISSGHSGTDIVDERDSSDQGEPITPPDEDEEEDQQDEIAEPDEHSGSDVLEQLEGANDQIWV
jgi:hypothetical protein